MSFLINPRLKPWVSETRSVIGFSQSGLYKKSAETLCEVWRLRSMMYQVSDLIKTKNIAGGDRIKVKRRRFTQLYVAIS